jgi:CDP-diacylglycerol--glycerol-3-phosphate 3-phosphatidyltransferase
MLLPNQLTVLRIILTPVFLTLFLWDNSVCKQVSLGIFIIASLTDWYDGWLARKFNYITDWGKFWDPLADKILTSSAFLGFVFLGVLEWWMVTIILLRDFSITGLRAYADYKNQKFSTSNYAKWKTFFQMFFLYYLLLIYTILQTPSIYKGNELFFDSLFNDTLIYIIMLVITIITVHSGLTYLLTNKNLIQRLLFNENKLSG